LATVHDAAAALAELGDEFGLARTHTLLCEVLWLQGRLDVGYDMAERAVEHARRARSAFEVDTGVSLMAWALVVNAVPVSEAKRRCRRLEREVGGRFAAMTVRGFGAVLDAMAGRFDVARAELGKARRGLAELGLKQASAWMAVYDAQAEMLAGDGAAAERALDDAERIALDIGDRWFVSTVHVDRAHAMLAQDRPGAAAEAVARIEDVPAHSDMEWVVKRHAARGKLAAREGDLDRALHESRKATAVADGTGMFTFRADAHRDLAEVAARCGRDDEARAATATALTLYEAKENAAAATRLRAR
jgi:tetratricopeptide (TPR) repeat protein